MTHRSADDNHDPVLGSFLNFLDDDVNATPQRIESIDAGLAQRLRQLSKGVKIDLTAALDQTDE